MVKGSVGAVVSLALTLASAQVRAEGRARVSVAIRADLQLRQKVERALAGQDEVPVEVRLVPLPNQSSAPPAVSDLAFSEALGAARRRYVEADFEGCLQQVPDDAALLGLLGSGQRTQAARVLLWRAACEMGRGSNKEAVRVAQVFARFSLELPPDVGAVTPDVERAFTDAMREVGAEGLVSLEVDSASPRLSVMIDGRSAGCVTPCRVEVVPGDHIVSVSGDGVTPRAERTRVVNTGARLRIDTVAATPELAALQWSARYGPLGDVESAESLRLLALAVRAPRLVLIATEPAPAQRLHLRGVYGLDGRVAARAGLEGVSLDATPDAAVSLLEELLVRGKTLEPARPLYKNPWFWTAVGVVGAGAATTTALLLREPAQRTEVVFK